MGPKVEAAVEFLERGGDRVIICALDDAPDALKGEAGTLISS
jgi:carbamate kinase